MWSFGLQIGHESIDGVVYGINGLLCQMGVKRSSFRTGVSEDLLNGPQVQAAFQKMCCVGMAQGVNGGVFADWALPNHDFERSVQGSGRYGI